MSHTTLAETGRPPYAPGDLLNLYIYGYLNRIRSSRKLEQECQPNVGVMWLLGKLAPDHKTIADFRLDGGLSICPCVPKMPPPPKVLHSLSRERTRPGVLESVENGRAGPFSSWPLCAREGGSTAWMDLNEVFPNRQPQVLEIASELRTLILRIFPAAVVGIDEKNMGFGFGGGYKDLVFVISPYSEHVNLGIVNGASLQDPQGLMEGTGKVHRHVKLQRVEQLRDPYLEKLMLVALQAAQNRIQQGA